LALIALAVSPLSAHAADQSAVGQWGGALHRPDGAYRVRIHVHQSADGMLVGTIYGLPETSAPAAVDHIKRIGERLSFDTVMGHYSGVWDEGSATWVGTWKQADLTTPLALRWDSDNSAARLAVHAPDLTVLPPRPNAR
jgi:hypothetical protein